MVILNEFENFQKNALSGFYLKWNIFHKVVYKITMPDYLTLYSGDSRLRRN